MRMKKSEVITVDDYKKLAKAGRVGNKRNGDTAKLEMERIIKEFTLDGDYQAEYKFDAKRRFKFDFAILRMEPRAKHIAVEYEGLGLSQDGNTKKSGHNTPQGYTSNCEKYNLAAIQGWVVLRYTAINYKQLRGDLEKLFNLNKLK